MIEDIITLSRQAGKEIMQIYNDETPIFIQKKQDASFVTTADLTSHRIIISGLKSIAPDIPILSEEDSTTWTRRTKWYDFWAVDPLDGTKEFLTHNNEFTVNIALIKKGKPVLGVIYAPAINVVYAATYGKAWKIDSNSQKTYIKVKSSKNPLMVISRSHTTSNYNQLYQYFCKLGGYRLMVIGSSLKFCLVAEGVAQLYLRFGQTNIWDTAAGHAIAIAAGAKIIDWKGDILNYVPSTSLIHHSFYVLSSI